MGDLSHNTFHLKCYLLSGQTARLFSRCIFGSEFISRIILYVTSPDIRNSHVTWDQPHLMRRFFARITASVRAISKWKSTFILKTISCNTYVKEKASPTPWKNAKLMDSREKKKSSTVILIGESSYSLFFLTYNCGLAKDSSSSIISLNKKDGGIEKILKEPQATSFSNWFISSNHPKWNPLFLFSRLSHCSRAW